MNARELQNYLWKWLLVAAGLHAVALVFSIGHQSVDEHFQILEFAGYKLGITPVQDMPVELGAMIRPWLQPGIVYSIVRAAQYLGIQNPFHWAFVLRALSLLLGWLSLWALGLNTARWFRDERSQRLFIRALALIWFLPALHARISSENWGGSTFLIALGLACAWNTPRVSLLAGFIAGLSFEFRYQMGFMVAGLGGWLVLQAFRGGSRKAPLYYSLGVAPALALGVVVDYWGYGKPVLAPWNYFHYNIVQGVVESFGGTPWWSIWTMTYTDTWPVLGSLTLIACAIAWIRHPLHPLTWAQIPFLLVHEWIGHKELRFFYPIAAAAPAYLALALSPSAVSWRWLRAWPAPARALGRWIVGGLEAYQLLALVLLTTAPASRKVVFESLVQAQIPSGAPRFELYYDGLDPYEQHGTPIHFYRDPVLMVLPLSARVPSSAPYWYSSSSTSAPPASCELIGSSLPDWLASPESPFHSQLPTRLRGLVDRLQRWSLYRCQG